MIGSFRTKAGIQIGEQHIKLIIIQQKRNKWVVTRQIIEPIPKDIVKNGDILQPDMLGLKIKNMLLTNKIKIKQVSVFIEELMFFVRNIRLPKMSKPELQKAVEYKAQLEIPVELQDLMVKFYPLERQTRENSDPFDDYVLMAVYKSMIDKLTQAVQAAGLSIRVIGLEPRAIYEGLKYKDKTLVSNKNVLIVRMDTNRLMLSIFTHGKLVYSRYLPLHLSQKDWEQEIERTLMSWQAGHQDKPIQEMILLGEQDYWNRIKQKIESLFQGKVTIVTSPFTACLGIALKSPSSNNFYENHSITQSFINTPLYLKAGILLVLLFVFAGLYQYGSMIKLQKEIQSLQNNISQNREVAELVRSKSNLVDQHQKLGSMMDYFHKQHADPLYVVQLLKNDQPPEAVVTHIHFTKNELLFSGEADDPATIMLFLQRLQETKDLSNVRLVQSSESGKKVRFSIKADRKGEPTGAKTK